MTAALTPEIALGYLRELSADVRAGVVLDGSGTRLAGAAALAEPAAMVVTALAAGEAGEAMGPDGAVFAVRGAELALVLACGPHALPELVRHDLRVVLADLEGRAERPAAAPSGSPPAEPPAAPSIAPSGSPREVPAALASAVLSAAQRGAGAG